MFTLLHRFTTLVVTTYSDLWDFATQTISEIAGEEFANVIEIARGLLEKVWIIGEPLSNLLTLLFNTEILTLILGSVGVFMAWQLITWVLNLIT